MRSGDLVFAGIGAVAVIAAFYAVVTRYLLRSIVALGAFLTALSGEFFLLGADYVAVVQIFVYVGGVVVLMLFALMLSATGERHPVTAARSRPLGAFLAYGLGAGLVWAVTASKLPALPAPPLAGVRFLGLTLLHEQLYAFELVGVILLAALVAALTIIRGERQ
jgi:NADH-quinone oxidoreductase subunit J